MSNGLRLRIVTPTRNMFDEEIDSVIVRTQEGEMAFLKDHIPLTTTLGYGIMRINSGGKTREASVLGGFVAVADNLITVISEVAEWPEEIDVARASQAKERSERVLKHSTEHVELRRAELAFRRATVRLEVSSYTIIKGRVTLN